MESGLETLLNQLNKEAKPIIVNSEDLELQAKQQLDPASYDFVAGGAGSELTLRANLEAFQKIAIVPRVLTGIRKVDTSTNLLGQRLSMPIYVTPMANHGVDNRCPRRFVDVSTFLIPVRTRGTIAIFWKASRFALRVSSEPAPPATKS